MNKNYVDSCKCDKETKAYYLGISWAVKTGAITHWQLALKSILGYYKYL